MALVFIAIDPGTTGDHCPAVFAEEETGDLLFQGWTVTEDELAEDPAIVKLCAQAFEAVWERAIPHDLYRPV